MSSLANLNSKYSVERNQTLMGVLLLGPKDHYGLLSFSEGVNLMGEGYRAVAESPTKLSNPRTRTNTREGFRLTVHQGVVPSKNAAFASARGERVSETTEQQKYPSRGAPVFTLFDASSAELSMVMIGEPKAPGYEDIEGIGSFQTACCAAYGTDLVAAPGASKVGVLGSGAQAILHLAALAACRQISSVSVYSPTESNRAEFARRMSAALGLEVRAYDNARSVVEEAEILLVCTNANVPVFDGDWLQEGAHVTSIVHSNKELLEAGLVKTMRQEIDDQTLRRSALLVTTSLVQEELDRPAVLYGAAQRSVFAWESVVEIADILSKKADLAAVHANKGITFLHNAAGWAIGGASLLAGYYDKAIALGKGLQLDEIPSLERDSATAASELSSVT